MKKPLTLEKIIEDFNKKYTKIVSYEKWSDEDEAQKLREPEYLWADFIKHNPKPVKRFLIQSIKDALEACRVENIDQVELPNGRTIDEKKFKLFGKHMMIKGYNQCTTQYDENVLKFLGEEVI